MPRNTAVARTRTRTAKADVQDAGPVGEGITDDTAAIQRVIDEAAAPPMVLADIRLIPIERIVESPLNPRKRFDEAALDELAASMRKSGQLTPVLARPAGDHFELAAGHRRRRAAARAGFAELQTIVREMDDAEFMEILTIENLQREDVHPLEEAQGFADLIKHAGYDVARIHERTGKSHRYVYDRLRLLELTPMLQHLFLNDEFTVGHAIILARLSAADQKRAIEDTGALFNLPQRVRGEAIDLDLDDRRKPMSTKELQRWVDHHVRFDAAAEDVVELFPETAAIVAPAIEQAEKVIAITHNHFVQPEAKDEGERTYGPSSWKRADGQASSKECDRSVIGVIVVGLGRGESFRVCIAKKTCTVHWAKEQREAKQRATSSNGTAPSKPAAKPEWEVRREREEAARAAWTPKVPQILDAVAARVAKMPTKATGMLGDIIIAQLKAYGALPTQLKRGTTADDLVRYAAFIVLAQEAKGYTSALSFPKRAKTLGVDLTKILKPIDDTKPRFPATVAKKSAPKKKAKAGR